MSLADGITDEDIHNAMSLLVERGEAIWMKDEDGNITGIELTEKGWEVANAAAELAQSTVN